PRYHAVPIVIGVARPRYIEAVLHRDQSRHRVRRRAVHPDLPVPIDGHEPERRVDDIAHHGESESIAIRDSTPVADAGAAEWIDAELEGGAADRVEIDDAAEISDVGAHVVV